MLLALSPSASGGAPARVWMDPSSGPDPGAQAWGDSVIRSGESPVIVNTAEEIILTTGSASGHALECPWLLHVNVTG